MFTGRERFPRSEEDAKQTGKNKGVPLGENHPRDDEKSHPRGDRRRSHPRDDEKSHPRGDRRRIHPRDDEKSHPRGDRRRRIHPRDDEKSHPRGDRRRRSHPRDDEKSHPRGDRRRRSHPRDDEKSHPRGDRRRRIHPRDDEKSHPRGDRRRRSHPRDESRSCPRDDTRQKSDGTNVCEEIRGQRYDTDRSNPRGRTQNTIKDRRPSPKRNYFGNSSESRCDNRDLSRRFSFRRSSSTGVLLQYLLNSTRDHRPRSHISYRSSFRSPMNYESHCSISPINDKSHHLRSPINPRSHPSRSPVKYGSDRSRSPIESRIHGSESPMDHRIHGDMSENDTTSQKRYHSRSPDGRNRLEESANIDFPLSEAVKRKDVKGKVIKNKYTLLKQNRMKKLKGLKEEKKKMAKMKAAAKPEPKPGLRDIMDNVTETLQMCFGKLKKIDDDWKKRDYSQDLLEKTSSRLYKQLDAMDQTVKSLKNDTIKNLRQTKLTAESAVGNEKDSTENNWGCDEPADAMEVDSDEKEKKKHGRRKQKLEKSIVKEKEEETENEESDAEEESAPRVDKKEYVEIDLASDEDDSKADNDDDEDNDDEDTDFEESEEEEKKVSILCCEVREKRKKNETPCKKKMRRIIQDKDLMETTKKRQKQFNQIVEIDVEKDQINLEKLVLEFDPETNEELFEVDDKLVKQLKPHQVKGVKFLWDSTIESIQMLETKEPGSGCILAHSMGLGKTFQVITYIHSLLSNKRTSQQIQHVMVCCPVNTIYNWCAEFSNWLKGEMFNFKVFQLVSAKDSLGVAYRLDDWWKEGGVCIMGYDMFRNLSNPKSKRFSWKMKSIFQKTLVDPGPDILICDEGHLLKNEKTALSMAINKVKTKRRIVLTGTPLQNNLKEYHCMIQFVKPNLLGTKKEFIKQFVNPIEQGQGADADQRDVRRMKMRAHILHKMLEGCVQRMDHTVLKAFLPPKFEYFISIKLSEIQVKLYQYYLDNLSQGGPKRNCSGLFVDFAALSRIWTHPKVLELAVRRVMMPDKEDDLSDFICDEWFGDKRSKKTLKGKKSKKEDNIIQETKNEDKSREPGPSPGLTSKGKVRVDWWKKVLIDHVGDDFEEDGFLDKIEHSGKLILTLNILKESCSIGDKVLLFSQSLLALDLIEEVLSSNNNGELELEESEDEEPVPLPYKKWKKDKDYLRLDGSTPADVRRQMCEMFNSDNNDRCRLFLISTRAGSLGINLVGANRVILFDSSWNPSHDSQSIYRVYRLFGQKKPCYIYRLVAQGTMEEKIYSRQVTKMSTSLRVVDEHQIKRYFSMADLQQLYKFTPAHMEQRELPAVPEDRLLAEVLKKQKKWIKNYHKHDPLLENQTGEQLSEEERNAAWGDYENDKKVMQQQRKKKETFMVGKPGFPPIQGSSSLSSFCLDELINKIKAKHPQLSQSELYENVVVASEEKKRHLLQNYQRLQGRVYNLKNPMIPPEAHTMLPFGCDSKSLPVLEDKLHMLEEQIHLQNEVINQMTQRKDTMCTSANPRDGARDVIILD